MMGKIEADNDSGKNLEYLDTKNEKTQVSHKIKSTVIVKSNMQF